MALRALDRFLTVIVTATLTSAVWIVAGGTILQRAGTVGAVVTGTSTNSVATDGDVDERTVGEPTPVSTVSAGDRVAPVRSADGRLTIPVVGVTATQLVDTFTAARAGGARVHDAIDIMAPDGTPVVAAASGTVEKLFISKPGGMTIYVRTDNGQTIHYYAHLSEYAQGLAEGQAVKQGQRIGSVGHTGNASPTGPHLHFAIMQTTPEAKWWEPSTAINPYPLLAK